MPDVTQDQQLDPQAQPPVPDSTAVPPPTDSTTPQPAPPTPTPQPGVGSRIKGFVSDMAHEAGDLKVGHTLGAGLEEAANGLSNTAVSVARTVRPDAMNSALSVLSGQKVTDETPTSQANPFQSNVNEDYGPPVNHVDALLRSGTSFVALSALTAGEGAEAEVGKTLAKTATKWTLSAAKASTLLTLGQDPRTTDAITEHFKNTHGTGVGHFIGTALAANPHDPEWLAYTRSLGKNFLGAEAMEPIIGMALGVAGAARKWAPEMLDKFLQDAPKADKDVAQAVGTKVVPDPRMMERMKARQLRDLATKTEVGTAPAAPAPASVPGSAPTGETGYAPEEIYRGAENGDAQPPGAPPAPAGLAEPQFMSQLHPSQLAKGTAKGEVPAGLPDFEKASYMKAPALMPGFHPDFLHGDVDLPDPGSAQVEIGQRNVAEENLRISERGPSEYADGWAEVAGAHRAGGSPAIINQIMRDHQIRVPTGLTPEAHLAYVKKLAGIVADAPEAEGGPKLQDLASVAAKSLLPNTAPETAMATLAKAGIKDPAAHLVALHLYARALARQANEVAQALEIAPESPAAQQAVDRAYHELGNIGTAARGDWNVGPTSSVQGEMPLGDQGAPSGSPKPMGRNEFTEQTTMPLNDQGTPSAPGKPLGRDEFTQQRDIPLGDQGTPGAQATPMGREEFVDQRDLGLNDQGTPPADEAARQGPMPENQQLEVPWSPADREEFARRLRIAANNPAEALQAVRDTRLKQIQSLRDQADRATAEAGKMTPVQKAGKTLGFYMINNMISSMATLVKVSTSQMLMALKMPVESYAAGVIRSTADGPESWLRDIRGETTAGRSLRTSGINQATGYIQNVGEAFTTASRAFRAGRSVIDPMQPLFPSGKISPEYWQMGDRAWLHTAIGAPGRFHTSITDFTKTLVYRSHVRDQVLRAAEASGASPEEAGRSVSEMLTRAFSPTGEAVDHIDALTEARRATFTNELDGTLAGDRVQKFLGKSPITKLAVAPFQRIGTNAFGEAWRMAPGLAQFKASVQQQLEQGGDEWARAKANQALGAGAVSMGIYAALRGMTRGIGPSTPELRAQRAAVGIKPYSLQFGKLNLSMDRVPVFGPLLEQGAMLGDAGKAFMDRQSKRMDYWDAGNGNKNYYLADHPIFEFLRHTADFVDATKGTTSEDAGKALEGLVLSASKKALDPTWLAGVSHILSMMTQGDDPENEASVHEWYANQVQSLVPYGAFWKSINSDGIHREVRDAIDDLKMTAPGFTPFNRINSKSLEPDYNIFGRPTENQPGFTDWAENHMPNRAVGCFDKGPDWAQSELVQMGKQMPGIQKSTPGNDGLPQIDWTDRSFDQHPDSTGGVSPYARAHQILHDSLHAEDVIHNVMLSDDYKKMGDNAKHTLVAGIMEQLNQAAKQKVLAEPRYKNFAKKVNATTVASSVSKVDGDSVAQNAYRTVLKDSTHVLDGPAPDSAFTFQSHHWGKQHAGK